MFIAYPRAAGAIADAGCKSQTDGLTSVLVLAMLALLYVVPPANAGIFRVFYAYSSGPAATGPDGGTVTFTTKWKNGTSNIETAFIMPELSNGTTRQQAAQQTSLSLLANLRFRPDWTFRVEDPAPPFGLSYIAQGDSVDGRQAEGLANGLRIVGIGVIKVSAGIDPLVGVATFDVFSDGLPLSSGVVSIGIAGEEVFTSTTESDGSFKSIPEIKADLLQDLRDDGFTSAFTDPDSGLITVPNVSTGDPEATGGRDIGASFSTTAIGIGGSAMVAVAIPEPATLALLSIGVLCLAACSRRYGNRIIRQGAVGVMARIL